MAEIYNELIIKIKSFYYAPPDSSVGLLYDDLSVEEIEIWDNDTQIKNADLEEYFLKKYQDDLVQAVRDEKEELENNI